MEGLYGNLTNKLLVLGQLMSHTLLPL